MWSAIKSLVCPKSKAVLEKVEPKRQHLTGHMGHRRRDCWWDPIYSPDLDGELTEGDWNFNQTAGPCQKFFIGKQLDGVVSRGDTFKVIGITFKDCDFQGLFDSDTLFMFDRCIFVRCDFAYSKWIDAHFRNCIFENCSFSLSHFNRCEFRSNKFKKIGISGSKTVFDRTFVTNPNELIEAGCSGVHPDEGKWKNSLYQWFRLQGTRAHLARTLLSSHDSVGDDYTFYKTAKLHDLQQSKAKIASNIFNILFPEDRSRLSSFFGLIFNLFENLLLRLIGLLNGWGASALRPLIGIAGLWLVSGWGYLHLFGVGQPWQKSFNITILAGYSNEYVIGMHNNLAIFQSIHAVLAVIFYTIFFGTIIARLSRVR
ncbi:hypothetical protein FHS61_001717 [Altererythrobacter atlanticus]|uniref:Uncharacterized protein n=1 Tax=Croceibacterium atlanticum TaxID=1267766 RepID=A0A0F7KPY0_9SPHN|nr:pentapeptide repeat-containing protein [Croceibacterium atlanticum]AKH41191.1 hypothetical protein WYH_00125 [Croceibacterium atlanticum]MBB5732708.1 hypothetical protein [Croceibacterium atlanticum]